ncbi:hypothetical protein LCGC14_1711360 [marine sediment metagenome]|uniref:HTH cro/C1-type domain-containing protein n=1 Tax=marine sediment metagenome TaxID=412755 RepID=A0A0F9KF37_9ZZZZ
MSERRKPAQVFHPGEYIADELEERKETPAVLRSKHWEDDKIEALLDGKLSIDTWLALHLHRIWGTSAELWLNLQAPWDEWPDRRSMPPAWRKRCGWERR